MNSNADSEIRHLYPSCSSGVATVALPTDGNGINVSGKQDLNSYEASKRGVGRKRKTRRFKNRTKTKSTPYSKIKRERENSKKNRILVYPQSEAPNNTNQFLMAYHHQLENLDDAIQSVVDKNLRERDSSFTSASPDSDDEGRYDTPEELEYLNRDFYDTYSSIHEEALTSYSKNQLIQIVVALESRVDSLENKLKLKNRVDDIAALLQENETDETETKLKSEVRQLLIENERLHDENEKLRCVPQENRTCSSSSSSSCSSGSSSSEDDNYSNSSLAKKELIAAADLKLEVNHCENGVVKDGENSSSNIPFDNETT